MNDLINLCQNCEALLTYSGLDNEYIVRLQDERDALKEQNELLKDGFENLLISYFSQIPLENINQDLIEAFEGMMKRKEAQQ